MFNLRHARRGVGPRLVVLLTLLALAGTACSDLEGMLPVEAPEAGSEDAASEPAAAASEDAEDAAADAGAPAAEEDAPAEGDAAAGGGDVEPITAADVEAVCGDAEARATTAEELAPLVELTPESFDALACSAFDS